MNENVRQLLAEYPVTISLPVQWGDQDAFGHVNNAVYFRWFESARIAYLERVGLHEKEGRGQIGPILASIKCDYRRQLRYPDTVHVGSRITRLGRTSITMAHLLVSEAAAAVAAEGDSAIVVFDYQANRSHPIPATLRAAIEALEGRTFE